MKVRNARTQQCSSMMDTWYNKKQQKCIHKKGTIKNKYKCLKSAYKEKTVTYLMFAIYNPAKWSLTQLYKYIVMIRAWL